jgi:hypothetical protein
MITNITTRGFGPEPYFVETVQFVPTDLPEDRRAALGALAETIIEITGMGTGILHLEAIDGETVHPVEWAVREPGAAIMDLINWRFGGQATPYLVGMHLRHPLPGVPAETEGRLAVTVFVDLPAGTIVRVRQDRDPNTITGVVDFDFYAAAGDVTAHARDNWGCFGAYSVFAEDTADLCRVLDELDAAFGVLLRDDTGEEVWWPVSTQARAEMLGEAQP